MSFYQAFSAGDAYRLFEGPLANAEQPPVDDVLPANPVEFIVKFLGRQDIPHQELQRLQRFY